MRTVAVLKGFHKRGIICVDFSGTFKMSLDVVSMLKMTQI